MKILQLDTIIEKWEQTSNNYTGKTTDGEKPGIKVIPHAPSYKSLITVSANIYLTDPDTDFILDIEIKTAIQMDIDGKTPTLTELYDAYLAARMNWNDKILMESLKHDIVMHRLSPPIPFNELKPLLQLAMNDAYNQN